MISRDELQEVKDCIERDEYKHVFMNLWRDPFALTSNKDDNQRLLDLFEAAEHYAREDALADWAGLRNGDHVRVIRDYPNGTFLRKGQEAIVINTRNWVSVRDQDDRCWVIDASFVERIESDTQESIDTDAKLTATQYCEVHELEAEDGKHRSLLKCEHLLNRQRELDKRLFGGE